MKGSARLRALAVCTAALVVACKGPTGPQGSTGPQGAPGAPNVQYSPWFTPATWTKDTVFGVFNFNAVRVDSAITQAILDSGVVLVYGKLDGYTTTIWPTNQVSLLPIVVTYIQGSTTYTDTWSAFTTPSTLRLNFVDNQNFYNSISNAHQFRYIIVPGGVAISSARVGTRGSTVGGRYTREQLRAMPYEQVARMFHIPLN